MTGLWRKVLPAQANYRFEPLSRSVNPIVGQVSRLPLEFGHYRTGYSGFRIACRSRNSSNSSAGRQMTKEILFLQALIDKELSPKRLKSSPKRLQSSPKGFDSSAQGNALGTRSPNHHQP